MLSWFGQRKEVFLVFMLLIEKTLEAPSLMKTTAGYEDEYDYDQQMTTANPLQDYEDMESKETLFTTQKVQLTQLNTTSSFSEKTVYKALETYFGKYRTTESALAIVTRQDIKPVTTTTTTFITDIKDDTSTTENIDVTTRKNLVSRNTGEEKSQTSNENSRNADIEKMKKVDITTSLAMEKVLESTSSSRNANMEKTKNVMLSTSVAMEKALASTSPLYIPYFKTDNDLFHNGKKNNGWELLESQLPYDKIDEYGYLSTTEKYYMQDNISTAAVPLTSWSRIQIFFYDNWLWVFLIILCILLVFCLPGMIIQMYCHKFYLAYRREKVQHKKTPNTFENSNIELNSQSDIESGHHEEIDEFTGEFSQSEETRIDPVREVEDDKRDLPSSSTEIRIQPVVPPFSSSLTSCEKEPKSLHRIDVYSGPQLPVTTPATVEETQDDLSAIYDLPPFLVSPENTLRKQTTSNAIPLQLQYIPLIKEKLPQDANAKYAKNVQTIAIGNERIVESNPTSRSQRIRPHRREPKNKIKTSPPNRPPKPKQYKIHPTTSDDDGSKNSPRATPETKIVKEKRKRRRKPEGQDKSKPRVTKRTKEHNMEEHRKNHPKSMKRPTKQKHIKKEVGEKDSKLVQLRRREQLLREIIQGLNEAEMLQCKIDRTRKWTREQKMQTKRNRQMRDEGDKSTPKNYERPKRRMTKGKKDCPPKYEDVISGSEETIGNKKGTE